MKTTDTAETTDTAYITTVTGPIPADDLGTTLSHEHLYCDISGHSGKQDNNLTDIPLIIEEMAFFRKAGGQAVVEMTPVELARDVEKLQIISQQTEIHIISGIAFYTYPTYPQWLRRANVDEIDDFFVREIEEGTSGIQAGLIGELGSHNQPGVSPAAYRLDEMEIRVFQAAAQAQKRTGVAISTHASLGRGGLAQLQVLEQAGANLEKVAIGHCDAQWNEDMAEDMEYYLTILNKGAYCQFDLIGWAELMPDEARAKRIAALIASGYEKKILLSTDTCRRSQMHRYGGRGFDSLWRSFLPRLGPLGVTNSQIQSMLVEAPRAFLARTL